MRRLKESRNPQPHDTRFSLTAPALPGSVYHTFDFYFFMFHPAFSFHRIFLEPAGFLADANSRVRHPADQGTWVWHPAKALHETAILRFRRACTLSEPLTAVIHVTADQRFQLRCDGIPLTFGPDRCDLAHWTVHSLEITLPAGNHTLEALVWHLEAPLGREPLEITPPMAQVTWRGGFLLFCEGPAGQRFNTGTAPWDVEDLTAATGLFPQNVPGYHDIGPGFDFDLSRWNAPGQTVPASSVQPSIAENVYGLSYPGWALYPAELPEQRHEPWTGGTIRAARDHWNNGPIRPADTQSAATEPWAPLLQGGEGLIPPHSEREIIWDLGNYYCGYPGFTANGLPGAVIEWTWAEALYLEADASHVTAASHKGHRDEIEGKVFVGLTDRWHIGSQPVDIESPSPALWWRAGRYIRLRIKTGDFPLTLRHMRLNLTGYPLGPQANWESSNTQWNHLMPLFERAFRSAAHETWTDTPYYEQMCYVGDNVISALANYALFDDARLSRRSIRLFEWSRRASGFVAERYPCRVRQESSTFALFWPTMVRDYAWWRNNPAFVKAMLPGIRSLLAEFEAITENGLLRNVPGWPFIDWCPEWNEGCGPGVREGDSSIVNLQWVLALQAAAQVESAFGDPLLAERCQGLARSVFAAVEARYWDAGKNLFRDTLLADAWSEHPQTFALLTGLLDPAKTRACIAALENGDPMAQATIYGSFYVLRALHRHGREAELHHRLAWWFDLPGRGFTSTPEAPEPSRSDAHAWGAHPAWHAVASVAGVRPGAPGFAYVTVAPLPGPLTWIKTSVVHPHGRVELDLRFENGKPRGTIHLPDAAGEFQWKGTRRPLCPGINTI